MITVTAKVMGQPAKVLEDFEGSTVAEVQAELGLEGNYTFNVGGKPATKETTLSDGAYVVFAPSVKGAMAKKVTKKVVAKPTKKPTKKPAKKK